MREENEGVVRGPPATYSVVCVCLPACSRSLPRQDLLGWERGACRLACPRAPGATESWPGKPTGRGRRRRRRLADRSYGTVQSCQGETNNAVPFTRVVSQIRTRCGAGSYSNKAIDRPDGEH